MGACSYADVGLVKPGAEPAIDLEADEWGDDVFARELAEYRRDPETFKARNPPAVVTKLLELSDRRRAEQIAAKAAKDLPVQELPTEELQRRLLASLTVSEPVPLDVADAFERALRHVSRFTPTGRKQEVGKDIDAAMTWLRRQVAA
jgi:hypothetical protein